MENDLETVTLDEQPVLRRIKEWLLAQGAIGALMSGSGPTVFAIFRTRNESEEVGLLAKGVWHDCWVGVTEVQGTRYSR